MRVINTDWLNSDPIFYNQVSGAVSRNILNVIDWANLEFDPEGLRLYLEAGFSVLGRTPIRGVRFLPPTAQLSMFDNGVVKVTGTEDPCVSWAKDRSSETEVLERIADWVRQWELSSKDPIVLPLSGGMDSRLLGLLIQNRDQVSCFTYGLAANQALCQEVLYAREVARRLGLPCQRIPLGNCHDHLRDWFSLFGPSTHAHGMYQFEFYSKICNVIGPVRHRVLSGILGDVFAGSWVIEPLKGPQDVPYLFRSHGMHADPRQCRLFERGTAKEEFFETNRPMLLEPIGRIIWAARMKAVLLSYLIRVPSSLGLDTDSPFIDAAVARGMLTLEPARRHQRRWQKEFFRKHSVDVEVRLDPPPALDNSLNLLAMEYRPLQPLDERRLEQLIDPEYVSWINSNVRPRWRNRFSLRRVGRNKHFLRLYRRLRGRTPDEKRLDAYSAYLTLWPIQECLRLRDLAQASGEGKAESCWP